ncbi:MAG TPA: hypothetical protein VFX67_06725 [Burkholderiales bacterium]|nr:hypothetical protein [Burkholderiales bacterium]
MKTVKLALAFATCASGTALAQQDSPMCMQSNFDQARGIFTITNPTPGAVNQQCFLTVHPAATAMASGPDAKFVEGSYEIELSGGGGGGGGGGGAVDARAGGGQGGAGATPYKTVMNLTPGVYRLTIGSGGRGGASCPQDRRAGAIEPLPGGRGEDGHPTGIAEAYSGKTIAGFPNAHMYAGANMTFDVASGRRVPAPGPIAVASHSEPGIDGPNGTTREGPCEPGYAGGHGFIKMTLLSQAAPAPAPAPQVIQPAPAPQPVERPVRKDRG